VVHQQLGVRPDLGHGRVAFVPQVPNGQTSVQGQDIRLGHGSAAVLASHVGTQYRTEISTQDVAKRVAIGHTLPRDTGAITVELDGLPVAEFRARLTNRGLEVTVPTGAGHHTLVITVA
jgi:hypothetical protein